MINRNLAKVLSFRYRILAFIFVLLAGGLVLLPKYEKHEGISPNLLLSNVISPERYISSDELAHKIISQDPSFLLIDVRDEKNFNDYTLPYAINIPLEKLFEEEYLSYLDQNQFDVIFFSNDGFRADQAWLLCSRLDFKNLRVLNGGINLWFNTIINPKKPKENMATSAFELYSFRKSASMYFGVGYPDDLQTNLPKKKLKAKKVVTVKKKKKLPAEGGC